MRCLAVAAATPRRTGGIAPDVLHCLDLTGDLLGRLGGLHRKRFYFGCDHGEASAGLARARGFNRGIERKQICLPRNVADQVDDFADLLNRLGEASHMLVDRLRLGDGMRGNFGSLIDLTPDFADRSDQLFGGPGSGDHIGGRLVRRLHRARCPVRW